jgi:hypothetical protein
VAQPTKRGMVSPPLDLLKSASSTPGGLQALIFWSGHPEARFTLHSLSYALDASLTETRHTLAELIHLGLGRKQWRTRLPSMP